MSTAFPAQLAKRFYEKLNYVPPAARYLKMFDRSVEFMIAGQPVFHFTTQDGKLQAAAGAAPRGDKSVLESDLETWTAILTGQLGFYDAGGGYDKALHCVGGITFYPDISWVGILTRLAQENR